MKKPETTAYLLERIRTVPDFPEPGIRFKDITPLLADHEALTMTTEALAAPYRDESVDVVVGLESRGFLFGTNLAEALNASFVPVRKPGRLPAEVIRESYALEYGTDTLEIHVDGVSPGSRVIVHDDLIATGGTAAAATRLVERLGGTVIGYSFIIELEALEGRSLLNGAPVQTLLAL